MELEEFKQIINVDYPQKITNEWVDKTKQENPQIWDNIMRWGFCYKDMSMYDLTNLDVEHLNLLTFNSSTIWPDKSKMPKDFDPNYLLEERKNPMISIKDLHKKGITGKGVIVATIDSGFQGENHQEFKGSKIKVVNVLDENEYHFHAEGVLSNLCGQNLGVAPDVKCYHYNASISKNKDLSTLKALKDILNKLENNIEIRAVSISGPLTVENSEYKEKIDNLVKKIEEHNCKVVDSNTFGKTFTNVEYGIENNIENVDELKKAKWQNTVSDKVGLVCGGKVVPEFCSDTGYKYEQESCYSWTIPQAVGMYVLCLQVNKYLKWEEFENIAKATSKINDNGVTVANPKEIVKIAKEFKEYELDI